MQTQMDVIMDSPQAVRCGLCYGVIRLDEEATAVPGYVYHSGCFQEFMYERHDRNTKSDFAAAPDECQKNTKHQNHFVRPGPLEGPLHHPTVEG